MVIDCVGAENTIYDSIRFLNKRGILVVVGLFGTNIKIPLVPSVTNEYSIYGSLWGNYNELSEVIELAKEGKVKHGHGRISSPNTIAPAGLSLTLMNANIFPSS